MFKVHSPQLNTDRKLVEPVGELVEPIRLTIRRQSRHLRCNFCSKLFQNHLGFNPILPGKPASYGRFEFKTFLNLCKVWDFFVDRADIEAFLLFREQW
jgi:hypothetical protein